MYMCVCGWATLLHSRKLTEHCKPAIVEKIKTIINEKKKNPTEKLSREMVLKAHYSCRHPAMKIGSLKQDEARSTWPLLTHQSKAVSRTRTCSDSAQQQNRTEQNRRWGCTVWSTHRRVFSQSKCQRRTPSVLGRTR